jgi:hypothetical protein
MPDQHRRLRRSGGGGLFATQKLPLNHKCWSEAMSFGGMVQVEHQLGGNISNSEGAML